LAITGGRYSTASRLRGEMVDPVAARLASNLRPHFTEADLIGAMGRFATRHPEHFRTSNEVGEDLRRAWREKAVPKKVADVNRETLAKMSAAERLAFANGEKLPQFVTEENDDE
jgi:hypothetical protein